MTLTGRPPDMPVLLAYLVTQAMQRERRLSVRFGNKTLSVSPQRKGWCVTLKSKGRGNAPVAVNRIYFA